MTAGGYFGQALVADASNGTARTLPLPDDLLRAYIGGAGLGILAAAQAFGLDFVPVTREPYDLAVTAATMDSPLLAPLWALLDSSRFRAAVAGLGGYSTEEMGRRIR
jgi:PBP superfamily domain